MMDQSNLDELFRQRLYDANVPPPPQVWTEVDRILRRKRRRRFLLIWLLAGGLIGAGLWGTWTASRSSMAGAGPDRTMEPPVGPAVGQAIEQTEDEGALTQTNTPRTDGYTQTTTVQAEPLPQSKNATRLFARSGRQPAPVVPALVAPVSPTPLEAADQPVLSSTLNRETTSPLTRLAMRNARLASTQQNPKLERHLAKPPARGKNKPKKCYDFTQSGPVWLLEAYVGPSFAQKLIDTENPEFFDYRDRRLATERTDWAFNAGLGATLIFARNFAVRTGLHYEQMTEVFENIDPNSIIVTTQQTTTWVGGMPVVKLDTIGIDYGANYVKRYNRFGMLDIPLQLGLELRGAASGLRVHAGASLNVLFWKEGGLLEPNGYPGKFSSQDGTIDVFKARTGLSLMGSIQWFYHVGPRTRVFAEPYYRKIVQPVSIASYPLEQRYGLWGVQVGVSQILK